MESNQSLSTIDIPSRLRVLEKKQENLREKLLMINQNMVEEYKHILFEVKSLVTEIRELKTNLTQLQESVKSIVKDSDDFARKDSVKVLEKYINLWNPLNFVTQEELELRLKKSKTYPRKKRIKNVRKKVSKRKRR